MKSCFDAAADLSLEAALEFINDDELVEVTPSRSACASATWITTPQALRKVAAAVAED